MEEKEIKIDEDTEELGELTIELIKPENILGTYKTAHEAIESLLKNG